MHRISEIGQEHFTNLGMFNFYCLKCPPSPDLPGTCNDQSSLETTTARIPDFLSLGRGIPRCQINYREKRKTRQREESYTGRKVGTDVAQENVACYSGLMGTACLCELSLRHSIPHTYRISLGSSDNSDSLVREVTKAKSAVSKLGDPIRDDGVVPV